MIEKTIYLSYFLKESTPVYGGEEGVIKIERIRSIEKGDTSNNLKLSFPNHACTHIDFPFHFSNEGGQSQDYPASFWIFNKIGFVVSDIEGLEAKLNNLDTDIELLILKTGFSHERGKENYWKNQPVIPAKYASLLRSKFPLLRVFGFDMISLTSKLDRAEGKEAHIQFLIKNGILVLEDMNLDQLTATPSQVIIAPLLVDRADGAPCTVIALM